MEPNFHAEMKTRGQVRAEFCIDGEIVLLNDIGPVIGQRIIDTSNMILDSIKPMKKIGACNFMVLLKIRLRRIKIKRPPQPNRRKKKKARNKK